MDLPPKLENLNSRLSFAAVDGHAGVRILLIGDLDLIGAPDFLDRMEALLPALAGPIEVNLAAVDFIDGAGVRALLQLRHKAMRFGHRINLVSASPAVILVLDLLGCRELVDTTADIASDE